jgi:hypothetical protein
VPPPVAGFAFQVTLLFTAPDTAAGATAWIL